MVVAAILWFTGTANAQNTLALSGIDSIAVIIPEDYPAFNPPDTTPAGRPTLQLRALILRSAPWSDTHPAILLNPAHASVETLSVAIAKLQAAHDRGDARMIAIAVGGPASHVAHSDPQAFRILDELLDRLRQQREQSIPRIQGSGRQIIAPGGLL
jgi:hypothetical protein